MFLKFRIVLIIECNLTYLKKWYVSVENACLKLKCDNLEMKFSLSETKISLHESNRLNLNFFYNMQIYNLQAIFVRRSFIFFPFFNNQ